MNGGFGMVLDGSEEIDNISKCLLTWDVLNGVSLAIPSDLITNIMKFFN